MVDVAFKIISRDGVWYWAVVIVYSQKKSIGDYFDREQIHSLINTMDDVADLIQDSAETMALYDVRHMTDEIVRLTDLSVKCCERVRDAVKLLAQIAVPSVAEAALIIRAVGTARLVLAVNTPIRTC